MAYTVRLDKKVQSNLEKKVMPLLGVTVANKAFIKMIESYEVDHKKRLRLESENQMLRNELNDLRDLFAQKEQLDKKIIKALTKKF